MRYGRAVKTNLYNFKCSFKQNINFFKLDLKGNSTVKTSWAHIKDNTFNKFFPKYLGPNHFSKGEIVRQSSRIFQISTPCCSFPCRRESGQRPDL